MTQRNVFESNDEVIFNKIEDYRQEIESSNITFRVKIDGNQNVIKYENQKNELVGKIMNVFTEYYLIRYIPIDMNGKTRLDNPAYLSVKINDVKGLIN